MTAKEFLSMGWKIEQRIERRIEERERLTARLTAGRASNLTGMPRGGHYDWTDAAAKLADMDARIGAEIGELCRLKREISEAIDAVGERRFRDVLEMRYRNYYSWDRIAEAMHYEKRHVFRLHGEALQRVKVPERFA